MSSRKHVDIANILFCDLFTQGRLAAADEIYSPSHVSHDPASPGVNGPEAMKQFVSVYRTAFPDLQMTIEEIVSEGDRIVVRWTARGTHKGDLMGIAPTGKQTVITGINLLHIVDGKIQEEWVNWDTFGLMQQLGVVPAMG